MRSLWLAAAVWTCGAAPLYAQATAVPVEVTAELHDGARVELWFVVKSVGKEPMKYFLDALPWRAYGSATVVVSTPPGETLEPEWPIDDPGPTIAMLEPDQEMRGAIDLTARFPTLKKRRRETDLLVFWSYQFPRTMPQGKAARTGGWLVVPKAR